MTTHDPTRLPLGPAGRPVFGGPTSPFAVPPQTTAPPLTLAAQVLPTPEAQREAARLAGQAALFAPPADSQEEPR